MSGFNWLKWVSSFVHRLDCPRSRKAVRHEARSATESLEPRALLSGTSLLSSSDPDAAQSNVTYREEVLLDEGETTKEFLIHFRAPVAASDVGAKDENLQEDEGEANPEGELVVTFNVGTPQGSSPITFTLPENSAASTVVGTVVSADPDADANISYVITSGNEEGRFLIDFATGTIRVANGGLLDYETSPVIQLAVQITDNSDPNYSGLAEVTIVLTNVNEAPLFPDETLSIPENSETGTIAGDVFASDPDVGSAFQFSITDGNTGGAFAIDAYTGKVSVANGSMLNYETRATYYLTVQVADNGSPALTASAQVTISLLDSEDPPNVSISSRVAKYRVGDGSVRFANSAIILDEDSPDPDFDGMVLGASITSGRSNKDVLWVKDSGSKSTKIVIHGRDVVFGRIVIGQIEGGRGRNPELRITLNSFATKTSVEALLRAMSFSTKDTSTKTRTLEVRFSDADGEVVSATTRSIPIKKKVERSRLPGWGFF